MYLDIYGNRSGEHRVLRRLAPNETLDVREHVRRWVAREYANCGATPSFSEPGSRIPSGCCDYEATIRSTKRDNGTCWNSEPFYIEFPE